MTAKYWNKYANVEDRRNEDNPEDFLYYLLVQETLSSQLASEDIVLDVGGGTGRFCFSISPKVDSVTLLDFSEEMLAIARKTGEAKKASNVSFVLGDARDLSQFGDQNFDISLAINGAITFSGADWEISLSEMCRVSKKKVIFTVSNYLSALPSVIESSLRTSNDLLDFVDIMLNHSFFDGELAKVHGIDFPSFKSFEPDQIVSHLARRGFEVCSIEGIASICRFLSSEHLALIVNDSKLLEKFLKFERVYSERAGKSSAARELLFVAERTIAA